MVRSDQTPKVDIKYLVEENNYILSKTSGKAKYVLKN